MTPKAKSIELVEKFKRRGNISSIPELEGVRATQYTLICVDEMMGLAYDVEWKKKEDAISKIKFLKEVKQELLKL